MEMCSKSMFLKHLLLFYFWRFASCLQAKGILLFCLSPKHTSGRLLRRRREKGSLQVVSSAADWPALLAAHLFNDTGCLGTVRLIPLLSIAEEHILLSLFSKTIRERPFWTRLCLHICLHIWIGLLAGPAAWKALTKSVELSSRRTIEVFRSSFSLSLQADWSREHTSLRTVVSTWTKFLLFLA